MSAGKTCEEASVCLEMILFLCTLRPAFINVSYGLNDLDIKMLIYLRELFLNNVKHKLIIQLYFLTITFHMVHIKCINVIV